MIFKNTALYTLLIILLIQNYTLQLHAQSYTIKTLLTPKTELGLDTGLTVIDISFLSINNRGDVIIRTILSDGTGGIILFSDSNIKLLTKSVPAQPINENVVLAVGPTDINDNGEIFFCGHLSPDKLGIFKILNDNIIPLVSENK